MPPTNRLMDDFARLVTDATGAAQGIRREVETTVRAQIERLLRDIDVPTREEVDVLRDMVVALGQENEALKARVATLEAAGATGDPGSASSSPGKRSTDGRPR